jgi:hypothetical protein
MSNSKLVTYTRLSPNCTRPRRHRIDTITIHCMAGDLSVESCGAGFANPARNASSNYGIDSKGRIALYVDEVNRSWCSGNADNDHRAITIEVANTVAAHPWPVSDAAYRSLIDLLTDICQRNGIKKLLWRGDKSLIGQVDKQNMTVHRWFQNKACPGDYLYNRHGQIADEVNRKLEIREGPDMTEKETKALIEKALKAERETVLAEVRKIVKDAVKGLSVPIVYKDFEDLPEDWGRATVQKLLDRDLLQGTGDGLNLSYDMLRILVILDRAGIFD